MHVNKRMAALLQRREELRKEARALAEAVDIPTEELEEKSEKVVKALAEVQAAIDALAKLLEVTEEVEEEVEETESEADPDAEGDAGEDPAAPTEEDRARRSRGRRIEVREARWGRRERRSGVPVDPEMQTALVHYISTGEVRGVLAKARERREVVDTDSAGVLIPLHVEAEVVTDIGDMVVMRQLGTAIDIPGNINLPVIDGISKFAPVPENAEYPEVEIEFGGPMLRPLKIGGTALISYEITRLAPHNAEAMVSSAMAEGRAENEDELFIVGTGVGQPTGVVTAAEALVTAAADAAVAQDFIDLFYRVPQRYRANGSWLMHPLTASMLRGLEDSAGNPLWYPGLAGQPETLLGRPVYTSEYMPQIGTGNKSVLFGDFAEYRIGDREGMWIQVLREAYARRGQIGIQLTYFVDANLRRKRAIGAIQHA